MRDYFIRSSPPFRDEDSKKGFSFSESRVQRAFLSWLLGKRRICSFRNSIDECNFHLLLYEWKKKILNCNFHGRLTRCPWNWTRSARFYSHIPVVIELYWSRPVPVSSVLNLESCVQRCRWWPISKLPAAFPLDPCPTVITSLLIRLRDTDRRASHIFLRYDRKTQ